MSGGRGRDVCVAPEIDLPLDAGTRVSLYPMAPVQVRSTGLYWSTDGLSFAPDGQIGPQIRHGACHVAAQCAAHVGRFTQNLLGYCN